ncbi:hypothetical protein F0562_025319 [Nyssa sinensis]|uniref:Uncharacterized protein n=1 Tax=Nyssa sinensis TaxID=561372 RepID=A0A5J5BHY3_9ASTE|nr:hypothetical protein F0562_025319 [Nyssa sinensis]
MGIWRNELLYWGDDDVAAVVDGFYEETAFSSRYPRSDLHLLILAYLLIFPTLPLSVLYRLDFGRKKQLLAASVGAEVERLQLQFS